MLFGDDGTHCVAGKTSSDYKNEKRPSFLANFPTSHKKAHPNLRQKRQKIFPLWHNCVELPLVYTLNQKLPSFLTLSILSVQ